jgi:hypothetical protein
MLCYWDDCHCYYPTLPVSVHVSHPNSRVFTGIDWKTCFLTHVQARDMKRLLRFAIWALAWLTLFVISVSLSRSGMRMQPTYLNSSVYSRWRFWSEKVMGSGLL